MGSTVCTLFEGAYHHGVGALVNSLERHGYQGLVWAGYKGSLPPWTGMSRQTDLFVEMQVSENLAIRFIQLDTDKHLTWFKPDLMLLLFEKFCIDADSLFYFDPDIVIDAHWSVFEAWGRNALALCADRRHCFPSTHPVRKKWQQYYGSLGLELNVEQSVYVNAGFLGVPRDQQEFLRQWKCIQDPVARSDCGYMAEWKRHGKLAPDLSKEVASAIPLFPLHDQDCLNAALEVTDAPTALVGPDAMGFRPGFPLMYHAVGKWKPWSSGIVWKGGRLLRATNEFLRYCDRPIKVYSRRELFLKRLQASFAVIPGYVFRFYRRQMWGEEHL